MTDSVRMEPTSYDYVTKDVCKKWSSDGKSDILGQFVDLQKNQGKGEVGKNSPLLKARTIVHELIWRCLGQFWVQSNKLPSNGTRVSWYRHPICERLNPCDSTFQQMIFLNGYPKQLNSFQKFNQFSSTLYWLLMLNAHWRKMMIIKHV